MGMESSDTADVTTLEWSRHYEGVGLLGWLCILLAVGKVLVHATSLPVVVPPAVLGGVIGCAFYHLVPAFFGPMVQNEMGEGMTEVTINLINFVFAGLILGFASGSSYVPKTQTRAILSSIWHEALPMLVYAQVLIWGQSACALAVAGLFHLGNPAVSPLLGAFVCLGLETGRDVPAAALAPWAQQVTTLADSLGLTISIAVGLLLVTVHLAGDGASRTSTGAGSRAGGGGRYSLLPGTPDSSVHGGGGGSSGSNQRHREHFQRGRGRQRQGASELAQPQVGRRFTVLGHAAPTGMIGAGGSASSGSLLELGEAEGSGGSGGGSGGNATGRPPVKPPARQVTGTRSLSPATRSLSVGAAGTAGPSGSGLGAGGPEAEAAGLGAHLSLLAISVFLAWMVDLLVRRTEVAVSYTARHHVVSGFRLFKLAMCIALALMCALRRLTPYHYKSEWFFRVSGLSLDLMAVAAISGITFVPVPAEYSLAFAAAVLSCLAWNTFVFAALGKRSFPNFWYLRAVSCVGDALGHSWVGLLLLRAMDPQLLTPVPLALAYKTMLFFVPASGGKNAIVIHAVDALGLWPAALACVGITAAWLYVFEIHVKPRMPHHHSAAAAATAAAAAGDGGSAVKDDSEEDTASAAGLEMRSGSSGSQARSPGRGRAAVERLGAGGALTPRQSSAGGGSGGAPALRLTLDEPSTILKEPQLRKLAGVLPPGATLHTWSLVYSLSRDGASLSTLLWNCIHGHGGGGSDAGDGGGSSSGVPKQGLLIVIEDSYSYCFGGYVAAPLEISHDYHNTGECFVWSFHPAFATYRWTGGSPFFVLCNESTLAMGGGGGGFAFCLDDELDTGTSNDSATFGNPRLSSGEFFKVLNVEVWAANERRYAL